jgi:hypothetical protein
LLDSSVVRVPDGQLLYSRRSLSEADATERLDVTASLAHGGLMLHRRFSTSVDSLLVESQRDALVLSLPLFLSSIRLRAGLRAVYATVLVPESMTLQTATIDSVDLLREAPARWVVHWHMPESQRMVTVFDTLTRTRFRSRWLTKRPNVISVSGWSETLPSLPRYDVVPMPIGKP